MSGVALFTVEVRRLLARRLVRVMAAVGVAAIVVAPFLVDWGYREQARIKRDADVEKCVEARLRPPVVPDAVASVADRARRCQAAVPRRDPDFHVRQLDEILRATAGLLVIAGFVAGASFVGAEVQSGALPTTLTWEGRRRRVYAAKLVAVAAVTAVAAALWQSLLGVVLVPGHDTDGIGGEWLRTTSGLGLRVATVTMLAGLVGAAAALLGRGTAAALGAGFGYVMVLENVASSTFKPLRAWLMLGNAEVFVKGQRAAGGDVPGRTVIMAAVLLLAYAAAVVFSAGAAFRRRDVA